MTHSVAVLLITHVFKYRHCQQAGGNKGIDICPNSRNITTRQVQYRRQQGGGEAPAPGWGEREGEKETSDIWPLLTNIYYKAIQHHTGRCDLESPKDTHATYRMRCF